MIGTIITYGLGGSGPSALILGPMRLYIPDGIVPPTPPLGGGGSHPMRPGEVQNFFKYVRGEEYLIPPELFFRRRAHIVATVVINGEQHRQEYVIEAPREQIILKSIKISTALPTGVVEFVREITPASTGELLPVVIDVKPQPIEATASRVTSIISQPTNKTPRTDK